RLPGPVGPEAEFSIRMAEAFDEMRGLEIRLKVDPLVLLQAVEAAQPTLAENDVDMLLFCESKARAVGYPQALGQLFDDEMIGARPFRRLDQLRPQRDVLVAAALVD